MVDVKLFANPAAMLAADAAGYSRLMSREPKAMVIALDGNDA